MTTETKFPVGEYKTRDGSNAKVFMVCEDGRLIGATQHRDGSWSAREWWAFGRLGVSVTGPHDLMPPLREWWVGVTGNGAQFVLKSQPDKENEWSEIIHVREVRDDQA